MFSNKATEASLSKYGLTLGLKLNLLSISLILLTAGVLAGFAVYKQSVNAQQELAVRGMEIAKLAALNSEYAIYTENQEELQQIANNLLTSQSVATVEIRDNQHKLLIRASNTEENALLEYVANGQSATQYNVSISLHKLATNKAGYTIIDVPVLALLASLDISDEQKILSVLPRPIIGFIRISLSQESLHQDMYWFTLTIMAVTLIVVLIGAGLTLMVTRQITSPLLAVVAATRRVAKGNFEQIVKVTTTDEIAVLAGNFNTMAANLKLYQQEANEHRALLEQKVAMRTTELFDKNHQLKQQVMKAEQAQSAAEQASQVKSEFLATMSHELRTPLNGVLGMTDILSNTPLDVGQQDFLKVIVESGNTLLDLLSDILDLSKIEAGKLELNYSGFNIRTFVEDLTFSFAGQAHNRGVDIAGYLPTDCALSIEGDALRLRQILSNLISNAIKFTAQGEVELRVDVMDRLDKGKVKLRFSVRDTGIGIDEHKLEHIFDSFTQADSSTTRNYGGTGLGLAISKRLIEIMGGEINVISTLGEGSTFWFELCLPARELKDSPFLLIEPRFKGLRVLIVDDLTTNGEMIESQLTAWGMLSRQVCGGVKCLEELLNADHLSKPYDLIMIDYHLPDMDGLQLAQKINTHTRLKPVKIQMLTSLFDIDSEQKLRQAGILSHLTKPFRQTDLFDSLLAVFYPRVCEATALNDFSQPSSGRVQIAARILLVEDVKVNRDVAAAMLDNLGCSVTFAESGCLALEAYKQGGYDMVLMDCQMPDMDGYQTTAAIRKFDCQQGKVKSIPIVALTANAVNGDRERCLASGMDDYLSKPFKQAQLSRMMTKWTPDLVVHLVSLEGKKNECNGHVEAGEQLSHTPLFSAGQAPVGATTSQLLDTSVLAQFHTLDKTGNNKIVHSIVKSYLQETPQYIQAMINACDNTEQLYKAAHALKSSSDNIGAKRLALLCKDIENLGRRGEYNMASVMLSQLQVLYQDTIYVLSRQYISE
jgi:signal transduction histidine kinase/CheY-like chemotaxis protein